jgi:hypothetical protein
MKHLSIGICILVMTTCVAQKKLEIQKDLKRNYHIKDEGKKYKPTLHGDEEIIRSNIIVNGDTLRQLFNTEGKIIGDSAIITIYGQNADSYHEYIIGIHKNQYKVKYSFITPLEPWPRSIETVSSALKLEKTNFIKGDSVRGYIEYEGRCAKGCAADRYFVKGNFIVLFN